MSTLYCYAFPMEGEPSSQPTDLTEPLEIVSKGWFRVVYTVIYEYADDVRPIAQWSTEQDRWVLVTDNGYRLRGTFTDFTMYEATTKETA